LNISYKNEPLLLSLGGCLEEKKEAKKWGIINKYVESYLLVFVKSFKIYYTIYFYYSTGCTSYVPQV